MSKRLIAKKSKHSRTPKVKPGYYVCRCNSVKINDDYADLTYDLKYTLLNKVGTEISFSELFVDVRWNTRTRDFKEYLADNGMHDIQDVEGQYEMVRIAWNFSSKGKRLPSIIAREFITQAQFESRGVLEDVEIIPGQ